MDDPYDAGRSRSSDITIGWVGDSRAYWLDGEGVRQLTVDDSFAAEGVVKGLLTPEQPGRLLLCSDGLWNYAPTIPELSALLAQTPDDASPVRLANALVDAALAAGGEDNVTVAVIDVSPSL